MELVEKIQFFCKNDDQLMNHLLVHLKVRIHTVKSATGYSPSQSFSLRRVYTIKIRSQITLSLLPFFTH